MKISPTSPGGSVVPSARTTLNSPDIDLADRAAVRQPLDARDDRRGLRLGARVQLPDRLGAEPVDPRLLQPRRARRGEVPHDLAATTRRSGRARRPAASRCAPSSSARRTSSRGGTGRSAAACARRRTCRRARRGCPRAARSIVHMNGPLWYSGPGIRCVPSICISSSGLRVGIDRARLVREDQLRPAGRAARRHRLPRIRDGVGQRRVVEAVDVERLVARRRAARRAR